MAKLKPDRMTLDAAEALALQGLTFLASDAARLSRFLSLTGTEPAALRDWAENRSIQAAVLEHFLADESLLLVFAAEAGMPPEAVAPAHALLADAT